MKSKKKVVATVKQVEEWPYELVTKTEAVPGPTEHKVHPRVVKRLRRRCRRIDGEIDWPFEKCVVEAEVRGTDMLVKVKDDDDDEETAWPVRSVFIKDAETLVVWWSPYEREVDPQSGNEEEDAETDFLVGEVEARDWRSMEYDLTGLMAGPFPKPSVHKVSEETYRRLLRIIEDPQPTDPQNEGSRAELELELSSLQMVVQYGENGSHHTVAKVTLCRQDPAEDPTIFKIEVTWLRNLDPLGDLTEFGGFGGFMRGQ